MDVSNTYHLYIGIDYEKLPNESLRKTYSLDSREICQLLNMPQGHYKHLESRVGKRDIKLELKELASSDKYQDFNILIYIAGHGFIDGDDNPSLMTSDWNEEENEGVRFSDIFERFNNSKNPRSIAIILDCCHSGLTHTPSLNRELHWVAATFEDSTTNNQFHESLVNYLTNDTEDLTILGLIDYLQKHGNIEQPSIKSQTCKPFYIRQRKTNPLNSVEINNYLLQKRGRLRTAYPVSNSFSQIYENGLFLSPKIINEVNASIEVSDFVDNYKPENSYLVLGSPGVGKSFLTFLLQKKFIEKSYCVIVLSFQEINELLSREESGLDIINKYLRGKIIDATKRKQEKLIFVIDGLDEFNEWEKYDRFFEKLTRYSSVIAFSREIEYNNNVSKFFTGDEFDSILKVKKWTYEHEFVAFLNLLLENNYIDKEKHAQIENNGKYFKDHLTTPLLSRMYIYVLENHDQSELLINNKGLLYSSYVQGLAGDNQIIIDFWRNITLEAFLNQRNNYSIINESDYLEKIKYLKPQDRRKVNYLLQLKREAHSASYNFIHFSFYEFFCAQLVYTEIKNSITQRRPNGLLDLFEIDLSFPIRHYLIDLLASDESIEKRSFMSFLYNLYISIKDNKNKNLISKNLIIYLISKQNKSSRYLHDILNVEDSLFLKNSLYWACARQQEENIFSIYISLLESDKEYGVYNRGYHLYYYGDIMSNDFPFVDNEYNTSWDKTKNFMMNYRINVQKNNSHLVGLLDIWTFIDLAIFHKTSLNEKEILSLKTYYDKLKIHIDKSIQSKYERLFDVIKGLTI